MNCQTYVNNSKIFGIFRHSLRENENYINKDIDLSRTKDNYQIGVYRDDPYRYYKERLSECYVYHRTDVKTLCEWVVTVPRDTPVEQEKKFFQETFDFLTNKFCNGNVDNVCLAIVHKDEKEIDGAPRAHLHYYFIPVVPDAKHPQGEKVCKQAVLPRAVFRTVHPEFQRYLKEKGIAGTVHSGVTATQRRSYSVKEIKNGVRDRLEGQSQKVKSVNVFTGQPLEVGGRDQSLEKTYEQEVQR
jgi:hypothetical protein